MAHVFAAYTPMLMHLNNNKFKMHKPAFSPDCRWCANMCAINSHNSVCRHRQKTRRLSCVSLRRGSAKAVDMRDASCLTRRKLSLHRSRARTDAYAVLGETSKRLDCMHTCLCTYVPLCMRSRTPLRKIGSEDAHGDMGSLHFRFSVSVQTCARSDCITMRTAYARSSLLCSQANVRTSRTLSAETL